MRNYFLEFLESMSARRKDAKHDFGDGPFRVIASILAQSTGLMFAVSTWCVIAKGKGRRGIDAFFVRDFVFERAPETFIFSALFIVAIHVRLPAQKLKFKGFMAGRAN
jgi:hypothetical protein